jgi:hypothetical protein
MPQTVGALAALATFHVAERGEGPKRRLSCELDESFVACCPWSRDD